MKEYKSWEELLWESQPSGRSKYPGETRFLAEDIIRFYNNNLRPEDMETVLAYFCGLCEEDEDEDIELEPEVEPTTKLPGTEPLPQLPFIPPIPVVPSLPPSSVPLLPAPPSNLPPPGGIPLLPMPFMIPIIIFDLLPQWIKDYFIPNEVYAAEPQVVEIVREKEIIVEKEIVSRETVYVEVEKIVEVPVIEYVEVIVEKIVEVPVIVEKKTEEITLPPYSPFSSLPPGVELPQQIQWEVIDTSPQEEFEEVFPSGSMYKLFDLQDYLKNTINWWEIGGSTWAPWESEELDSHYEAYLKATEIYGYVQATQARMDITVEVVWFNRGDGRIYLEDSGGRLTEAEEDFFWDLVDTIDDAL